MINYAQIVLKGTTLSSGIGTGTPVFLKVDNIFEDHKISKKDIKVEIKKYEDALEKSRIQIDEIKKSLSNDKLSITIDFLNTHLEILNDPIVIEDVKKRIKKDKKCVEAVFNDIVFEYKKKIKDPFFREKVSELADVFKRILKNIKAIKINSLKKIHSKSIIIANEIIPSDMFEMNSSHIAAIISRSGSYDTHAAIIARSKNIPFLSKVNIEKLKYLNFKEMIVDATNGKIILNPTKSSYEKYENLNKPDPALKIKRKKLKLKKQINIFANISNIKEVDALVARNFYSIGLLRTELLFLEHTKSMPTENMQFKVYKEIAQKLKNNPLIIRLFDLGGDKNFYNIQKKTSYNFFSSRGIALLLKNKKALENQLKAILKASQFGKIYILIPFVKDIEEITKIKKIIQKLQKQLKIISDIKIGSMIETPAAALIADEIINEVDFLSIGTNDLSRYTLASESAGLKKMHPSLIKLLKMIVKSSKDFQKPLFLCGEMIVNKKILNELIDLGIKNFSVGIKHIDLFH